MCEAGVDFTEHTDVIRNRQLGTQLSASKLLVNITKKRNSVTTIGTN